MPFSRSSSHKLTTQITSALLSCVAILLLSLSANGQEKSPQRGFQVGNSYAVSDIETINTTNGNLMLNIPLGILAPGRGGVSGGISLRYNGKLYDSTVAELDDHSGQLTFQNIVVPTEQASSNGGWHYSSPLDYELEVINRNNVQGGPFNCTNGGGTGNYSAIDIWKVKVIYPDGGEHEFRPNGYTDLLGDGFFSVDPNSGAINGCSGTTGFAPNPLTYFSTDGTFTRLTINRGVGWTLSFPDGSRLENISAGNSGAGIYLKDRNNNYLTGGSVTLPNGHVVGAILDQFGRYVVFDSNTATREDYIYSLGFNNQLLMWTVKWKTIFVHKPYETTGSNNGKGRGGTSSQVWTWAADVVDRITLPSQVGNLFYQFSYNAPDYVNGDPEPTTNSFGWGEVSGITMPSEAHVDYQYVRDGSAQVPAVTTRFVLENSIKQKTLTYLAEYDGNASPVTEVWTYHFTHTSGTITGPDNGVTMHVFNDITSPVATAGLVYRESYPNGEVIERIWQSNSPPAGTGLTLPGVANFYVKTEFRSISDANGNPVLTAIKDNNYDKNGNLTSEANYDWLPYDSVHPNSGGPIIPQGAEPKRVSVSDYYNATPTATDSTSDSTYAYWNSSAPLLRTAMSATEVHEGNVSGPRVSRTEFTYDVESTTGNLIQRTVWDSTKGPYSSPLATSNSISVHTGYNQYGMPTTTTDARGYQTQITYGAVGAFSDLYPTQIRTAYGASVQRTETHEYDFSTGLAIRVTDADNNVSTATTYDALGRPTQVIAAEGKLEATSTSMTYDDALRRVITRTDMTTLGDAKLVSINHYDQLGRVRLSRQLEDATTQSATDEAVGIKVQTRYSFSGANTYQVSSHPYREAFSWQVSAAMDWTRSKADNGGRSLEVEKFGGTSLPFPWGSNAGGSGQVVTTHDANFTIVTDQAGRVRRSMTNALGQMVRVDEPDQTNGNLDDQNNLPVQATSYTYDALGNLRTVTQGSQQRFFAYDSMSRLLRARNPEQSVNSSLPSYTDPVSGNSQWSMAYSYDNNGNLVTRIDARNITSTYSYDALNRNTSVTYTNDPANTPTVTRSYDGATNGKGKSWKSQTAGDFGSLRTIDSYDAIGRPLTQSQQFHSNDQWSVPFTTSATYNKAGYLVAQTYPSGHTVNYTFDAAGRISSFTGNLGDGESTRTYANEFQYTESGAIQQEKFGTDTPLYHKQRFNERGQLWDVRVSTVPFATDPANGDRGAIVNYYSNNFAPGGTGADNNGNLLRQETYIPGNSYFQDNFSYDKLNRLTSISEKLNGTGIDIFKQAYTFDRWGNRLIDQTNTWGSGINKKDFTVNTANNNRLGVPANQTGVMSYDAAGNLSNDTYTGAGSRVYDGENRMIVATNNNGETSSYTYDADGQRVGRRVGNPETWQVYGIGGELLAEYDIQYRSIGPFTFQEANLSKEYGYRNGQLLVTTGPLVASDSSEDSGQGGPEIEGGQAIQWIVTDQLGTPRMIFDSTGSLAGIKRHDYLPFGEELTAGQGQRSAAQGYGTPDGIRQQFTLKERDNETGLDYFGARYYASTQGRFTSADPLFIEFGRLSDPQQLNLYSYTRNNPLKFIDPTGLDITLDGSEQCEYTDDLNSRKKAAFQVDFNDKNKVVIVDKNGKALDKAELKALGKTLKGGEKELFKAITDDKHHAVIDTGDGTANSDVAFGRHDSDGHNTLDFADIRQLANTNNAGGQTPGGLVAHETLEAYYTTQDPSFTAAHEKAVSAGFGGLEAPPRNVQNTFNNAGDLISQTADYKIQGTKQYERITSTPVTPIPKGAIPRVGVMIGSSSTITDVRVAKKP